MALTNIFGLLGGLGLFLFGMTLMSQGLETAAGSRLKQILEKLTANRFIGVGVGALVAALTQSSSATTVMAIGFVNSGLMDLKSAVWIIMGANIGTTITGQLIALNFLGLCAAYSLRWGSLGHVCSQRALRSCRTSPNRAWHALHGAGAHVPIHGAAPLYARIYWSLG